MHEARAVGCRALQVQDPVSQGAISAWLLYPTGAPARAVSFGPYQVDVALDAQPDGELLPLVAVSHGNGGSPWTHRGTALHLARAGFAVALLEHPGNSRSDNRLAHTAQNLCDRPRHLALVLDAAFADLALGPRLLAGVAAVLGHSIGAYTALALAGGRPRSFPKEEPDGQSRSLQVPRDPRVRALVLLAPAAAWFLEAGSLGGVTAQIFLRTGALDSIAPHRELVMRDLAAVITDEQIVPNAGHFSFQSPFPQSMIRPDFPPSQDPPGFDRVSYQCQLNAEVEAFLRGALRGADR